MKKLVIPMMGLGAALLAACGPGVGQTVTVRSEGELEQVLPTLRPGDVVTHGGVGLTVPPEGMGVRVEALFEDGRTIEFALETQRGGGVRRVLPQVVHGNEGHRTANTLTACEDDSYTLSGRRWPTTFQWSFNASSTPAYLGVSAAESDFVQATSNITTSRNNCGLEDTVSATHEYLGRTSRAPQISASGTCDGRDGHNVVGFGNLPSNMLQLSCTVTTSDGLVENDLLLNKAFGWATSVTGCDQRYIIQAMVTRQRGSLFGLGLVSNPELTMGWTPGYCDNSPSTLGLGDVLGLRALY